MNNSPIDSRNPGSRYGKCNERVEANLAEDTKEQIVALARKSGLSTAEYVRLVLERHVYGAGDQLRQVDPLL